MRDSALIAIVGQHAGVSVRGGLALLYLFPLAGAAILAVASALGSGWLAAATILAVGLCNSIMFPTIFTLAIEGLGERAAKASGMICVAIVGGAVVPMITGLIADRAGLNYGLLVPAVCYVWICVYGWLAASGRLDRGAPLTA